MTASTSEWFSVRNGGAYQAIDFAVVARHRACIEAAHGASLEALNVAGGLDWIELWCGLHDLPVWPAPDGLPDEPRLAVLDAVIACKTARDQLGRQREKAKGAESV